MNRPFLRQYITVNILIILVSELNEDRLIELPLFTIGELKQ